MLSITSGRHVQEYVCCREVTGKQPEELSYYNWAMLDTTNIKLHSQKQQRNEHLLQNRGLWLHANNIFYDKALSSNKMQETLCRNHLQGFQEPDPYPRGYASKKYLYCNVLLINSLSFQPYFNSQNLGNTVIELYFASDTILTSTEYKVYRIIWIVLVMFKASSPHM